MKHTEIAKAITKAVEPFVRGMTEELVAIAAKSVAEQFGVAREHAIAKLREQLEGSPTDVEEHDERPGDGGADRRGGARARSATSGRDVVAERRDRRSAARDRRGATDDAAAGAAEAPQAAEPVAKKTRAKMACGKCGAIGYRADGCGRTHNTSETFSPPPPSQPPGRIGSRESRPLRSPAEASSDADEEPAAVGVSNPPTRRRRPRRARPRSQSFGRANTSQGQGWKTLDAKLGIDAGAPIEFDLDALRPKTRGECIAGIRPCVWVGCRHHLYLDINPETGSIKINFPELELEQLPESCSLDVADAGEHTLEQVGGYTNLTRERIRQVETPALNRDAMVAFRKAVA